jgi:hypothetical protein
MQKRIGLFLSSLILSAAALAVPGVAVAEGPAGAKPPAATDTAGPQGTDASDKGAKKESNKKKGAADSKTDPAGTPPAAKK